MAKRMGIRVRQPPRMANTRLSLMKLPSIWGIKIIMGGTVISGIPIIAALK